MTDDADLVRPLAARLQPAVALLAALLATGAPLAHHVMGALALRATAASLAAEVAAEVGREAQRRPALWRYDSLKLVEHLRAYRAQPGVARIDVVDDVGRPVDAPHGTPSGAALWAYAPVPVRGARPATAWVAMDLGPLRARSLTLLAAFSAAALALGVAVSRSAIGTAARAEERIRALLAAERRAAEALEAQVAARTEELGRANEALRAEQRRQRETAARAIALQEAERRAIGRDLHDSVGQALTAIRIQCELARDDAAALDRARATTDLALEELRRALHRLGPAALADAGLASAVARLLDGLGDDRAALSLDADALGALAPAAEVAAFRVVQEAVTNALRHAGPCAVRVSLSRDGDALTVRVVDDGRGFDPARGAPGNGITGMREPAELLGGTLAIESAPSRGTAGTATLPFAPAPALGPCEG